MPQPRLLASAARSLRRYRKDRVEKVVQEVAEEPETQWAFYRKHTENLLRRYLYASMQVGRSPNLLGEPVGRGWASSRRIRTFEDALIFVLDVERCLEKLDRLDRQIVQRVVLQEYTHTETAVLMGMAKRTVCTKLQLALDKLTERLVTSGVLVLPD